MGSQSRWRHGAGLLALLLCLGLLVAACGGGGSSSSSESTSESTEAEPTEEKTEGEEEGEKETAALLPEAPTEPPTEIPISKPLNEAPPAGFKLTWMACELPICQEGLSRGWKEASKALGWQFTQTNYKTLEASKFIQQALNEHPDGIGITGIPPAAFEAQAQQAIKEGIPISSGSEITEPEPEKNGLIYQGQNQGSVEEAAAQIADWSVNDAGGPIHMVSVTIEEYPILVAETEGLEKELAKCEGCTFDKLPVTLEDLGEGRVPQKIAAYLQSNPETDYVQFTFSDLATGAYETLKPLGLTDKVTFVGQNGNPTNMQEVVEGKAAMWTAQPQEYFMYLAADAMARYVTGTPLEPYEEEGKIPYYCVEKAGAEELLEKYEGNWPGPEGFQEKFEELWKSS